MKFANLTNNLNWLVSVFVCLFDQLDDKKQRNPFLQEVGYMLENGQEGKKFEVSKSP